VQPDEYLGGVPEHCVRSNIPKHPAINLFKSFTSDLLAPRMTIVAEFAVSSARIVDPEGRASYLHIEGEGQHDGVDGTTCHGVRSRQAR